MIHVGDITKLHGLELEPVDCITGGSPCQDLSLAGKRAGLAGERSSLFMEQVRLVKEMRDATRTSALSRGRIKPRYMVWENVAGAFSSNGGKDFQAVLTEIARIAEPEAPDVPMPEKTWPHAGCLYSEVGAWSIAWRLHDAQYWGVPQRRKRIALVADFGGMSAPEVLFERKGLHWDTAESGDERQGAAGKTSDSTGETSYGVTTKGNGDAFISRERHTSLSTGGGEAGQGYPCVLSMQAIGAYKESEKSSALKMRDYKDATDLVIQGFDVYNMAPTGDKAMTIRAANADAEHIPVVLESNQNHATAKETEVCPALKAAGGEGGGHVPMVTSVTHTVRRLTPLECEMLQGFPDGWTDIGAWTDSKGKIHKKSSDSARYKALGNSIALPFWFYLLRRISAQYERPATLGSLFDGIGGFPLCWERCNGKGTAIWASEVDEFCIAVTKARFDEEETNVCKGH